MNKKNLNWLVSSLLSCFVLTGCISESSTTSNVIANEADTAAVQIADNTIITMVNNFQNQAQLLDTSAELFCSASNTTTDNLTALQNQWKATSNAWYQLLPFKFGPMEGGLAINELEPIYTYIDSYRLKGTDYTSVVRGEITDLLIQSAAVSDATFTLKSFNRVGLLALELAIFEVAATQSNLIADITNEYSSLPRKCQILTGLSNQLLIRANEIQSGWSTDYAQTGKSFRELLANNLLETLVEIDDGTSAISKVTVSVQDYFDYLKNRDVSDTMGQISNSIWQSIALSVESVEQMLAGSDASTLSVYQIMNNNGNDADVAVVKANIATLKTAIAEQNSTDFKAAAGVLDGNFKREIPDAIGVSLGLNFSDGD